jgi:Tfp pilus assembly protein PilZ
MERRIHRRFPRRIELRFWRPGESQGHAAYTTNISKSGLFLNSSVALMQGERLRLELVDREHGFVAEGKVARVHRVALALRQVDQQGVGLRFLPPDELVESLVPLARQSGPVTRGGQPVAPEPDDAVDEGSMVAGDDSADAAGVDAGAAAVARRAQESAMDVHRDKVVPVQFPDPASFLSTYHRDITAGGLFVSTPDPMPLQATVWIEMQLPISGERPRLFAARVVQRFEPQAAVGEGRNLLSGMAVRFIEPEKVLEELRPLLAILRR